LTPRNSIYAPAKSCTHERYSRGRQSPSKHVTSQPYSGNWQAKAARDRSRRLRPRCVCRRQSAWWKPPSRWPMVKPPSRIS